MKMLDFLKANLRESLLKGVNETIDSLRELLDVNSNKYESVILLQSRLKEVKRKAIHGTISEEAFQLEKNKIRESIIELINTMVPSDIESTSSKDKKEGSGPNLEYFSSESNMDQEKRFNIECLANHNSPRFVSFIISKVNYTEVLEIRTNELWWDNEIVVKVDGNRMSSEIIKARDKLFSTIQTIFFSIRMLESLLEIVITIKGIEIQKVLLKINKNIIYQG